MERIAQKFEALAYAEDDEFHAEMADAYYFAARKAKACGGTMTSAAVTAALYESDEARLTVVALDYLPPETTKVFIHPFGKIKVFGVPEGETYSKLLTQYYAGDGDNPMYIVGNMVRDYLRDEWHLQAFNPEMGYKFVPTRLDWFLR